jgi:hypothetical protein
VARYATFTPLSNNWDTGDGHEKMHIFLIVVRLYKASMPRKTRIDAPGAFHHIICRGIERRKIFCDDTDRNNFLKRLENILKETSTPCYGWTLLPVSQTLQSIC